MELAVTHMRLQSMLLFQLDLYARETVGNQQSIGIVTNIPFLKHTPGPSSPSQPHYSYALPSSPSSR